MRILFLITLQISLAHSICKLAPGEEIVQFSGHNYSTYWAQEYVGVDLVKEEMRQIESKTLVPFVVLDTGFARAHINLSTSTNPYVDEDDYHHGTCVANIINGPDHYGASEMVNYLALAANTPYGNYRHVLNSLLEQKKYPKLISNSMKWTSNFSEEVEMMNEVGTIWVTSAGNHHPAPLPEYKDNSGAILVGSMRPNGYQADSSQASSNLTVIAPSNNQIATVGIKGEHRTFGGTSGAAPLVSGSLANVASLLPSINMEQARVMLLKSSIQSANRINDIDSNPAGILNSYKLFRVAKRISSKCHDSACIDDLIHNDETYFFEPDVSIIKKVERTFPRCHGSLLPSLSRCEKKQDIYNQLRKEALLNPENIALWEKLSCIANKYKLDGNSDYYANMALFNSGDDVQDIFAHSIIKGCYNRFDDIREITFSNESWVSIFEQMIDECHLPVLDMILRTKNYNQNLINKIVESALNKKADYKIRKQSVQILLSMEDPDYNVKNAIFSIFIDHRESNYLRKTISYKIDFFDEEVYLEAIDYILNNQKDSQEWHDWAIKESSL